MKVLSWLAGHTAVRSYRDVRRTVIDHGFVQQHTLHLGFDDGRTADLPACVVVAVADGLIVRHRRVSRRCGGGGHIRRVADHMTVPTSAQLTDTHVVDADAEGHVPDEVYVDNNGRLASAVASLNAEAPAMAVVLGTGDLTNWGRPGEYERLAALLAPLAAAVPRAAGQPRRSRSAAGHVPGHPVDRRRARQLGHRGRCGRRAGAHRRPRLDHPRRAGRGLRRRTRGVAAFGPRRGARRRDDARPAPSAVRHRRRLDGRLRLRRPRSARGGARRASASTRWSAGTSTGRCRRRSRASPCRSACRRCSTSTSTSRPAPASA